MMKKLLLIFLFSLFFTSCGMRTATPVFADVSDLATTLYMRAGLKTAGVYAEEVDDDLAFAFGMGKDEFDSLVDSAFCYRQTVDSTGQTLYIFETEAEKNTAVLAEKIYRGYEFPPCDASEKFSVAGAGKHVILFKSSEAEVDRVLEAFRALSGGALRFRKDMAHRG